MMATLFAQEFRTTRKNLLSTVGIVVLVAAVSLTLAAVRVPVIDGFALGVGILLAIVVTPLVLGILVENYWRTMYGREGYFTMTLPVRGRTLFAAKVVYGFVATLAALVVTAIMLLAAGVAFAFLKGQEPFSFVIELFTTVEPWMVWFAVFAMLLQVVYLVVVGAAVMSIGAEGRFNHLGFGAPVLGGVIVYLVMQIVTLAAVLFIPFGIVLIGPDAGSIVGQGMLDSFIAEISGGASESLAPQVLGLGFMITSVAATVLLAWVGARSVEKRTSLR